MKDETEEEVSAFGRAPYCSVKGSSSCSDPSAESCWLLYAVTIKVGERVCVDIVLCIFKEMGDSDLESHLCYNNSD